jgi:hypothetical protein
MAVFNGLFPVLPGKEDAIKAFAAETVGDRRSDFEELQARSSITRESWAVQETPMGSFVLVWFDGDVEKAFADLASDDSEFARWFRGQVLDITGVDLGSPPEGPLPEVVLEWRP